MKRVLLGVALAIVLPGCMVGPNYERPDVQLPARFPEDLGSATGATAPIAPDWWTMFRDPLLDELVASARQANPDIAQAVARVQEAEATLRAANAAILPELDLGANVARQALTNASPTPRVVSGMGFTLSTAYELDFWGRLRRSVESAQAGLLATRYARDVVDWSLVAGTAQAYFTLRALDALIRVTRETLVSFDASVDLTRRRAEGGVASDLDLRQAEVQRQQARVQLADLVRQRAAAIHQLQNLTARLDLAIPEGDLATLPVPVVPPPGLSSSLLERRPDVRESEALLAAQNARIGVARAAMFPTISLTGDFGGQSASLGTLLAAPGRMWTIGFGLALPLFDAGRRRAQTELEEARTREAVGAYQRAIQNAFRDVQDALSNVRQYADAAEDVRLRVAAADAAVRLSQRRYEAGYSAFLEVLIAQRALFEAQTGAVQNRQALMLATVDLMKALGGGWDAAQPVATGH